MINVYDNDYDNDYNRKPNYRYYRLYRYTQRNGLCMVYMAKINVFQKRKTFDLS